MVCLSVCLSVGLSVDLSVTDMSPAKAADRDAIRDADSGWLKGTVTILINTANIVVGCVARNLLLSLSLKEV